MRISQRIARSEVHFYIQKLINRGYEKVSSKEHKGGYIVEFVRNRGGVQETLRVKFSNNGWVRFS